MKLFPVSIRRSRLALNAKLAAGNCLKTGGILSGSVELARGATELNSNFGGLGTVNARIIPALIDVD